LKYKLKLRRLLTIIDQAQGTLAELTKENKKFLTHTPRKLLSNTISETDRNFKLERNRNTKIMRLVYMLFQRWKNLILPELLWGNYASRGKHIH